MPARIYLILAFSTGRRHSQLRCPGLNKAIIETEGYQRIPKHSSLCPLRIHRWHDVGGARQIIVKSRALVALPTRRHLGNQDYSFVTVSETSVPYNRPI